MSSRNALAEELEALKSIFDNDIKCDSSKIIITLYPLQEKEKKEIYVQVDLCIECSNAYPKKEPILSLKNVKGLSDKQLESLYCKLNIMAKSLRGEVMIYNLAYYIQEFLSENNKPGKKSCYEEMLLRKEQQKAEAYKSEVSKKNKLIKDIEEKHKVWYDENDSSNYESEEEGERCNHLNVSKSPHLLTVTSKKDVFCSHRNCKYIQFNNKVLRGRCIEHDTNSVIYCAIDSTTGDQLLLQEWVLRLPDKNQAFCNKIQQQLEEVQGELIHLKKLCHENLISYIDFKWTHDKGEWIIHLLQEYVTSFSLNILMEKSAELDLTFLRYILMGILKGLEHLHNNGVIHGCLNGSNTFISKTGIVKLSGYGIKKTIDYLHESCQSTSSKGGQEKEKDTRKGDILKLGFLLLKLLKLSSVDEKSIVVPDFQPPELKEFVEKCLIENEEGRWSSRKLLNHKFLKARDSVERRRFSSGDGDYGKINIEIEKPYEISFDGSDNDNSRLSKEFKILNFVGSGSFGKVLKVKNKLDGNVYAIKAIRLSSKNTQMDKKMIREVKLLSKLNHENVVRYYTSWVETDSIATDLSAHTNSDTIDGGTSKKKSKSGFLSNIVENDEDDDDDDDDDDDEEDEDEDEDEEDEEDDDEENDDEEDNKEADNFMEHYKIKKDISEGFICADIDEVDKENKFWKNTDSSCVEFLKESGDNGENESEPPSNVSQKRDNFLPEPNKTMYIQMEFCEKSTLRIAINDNTSNSLSTDDRRLWRLFREIVEGLAYVHGQGMIHRDLKPENIFLDSNDHVKIGDFGLATVSVVSKGLVPQAEVATAGGGDNDLSSQNTFDGYHTGRVGTSLYVAPELDKSFGKSLYNKKVDIYSLGILFFEMCHGKFETDMERIETILNLRKCDVVLPACWSEKLPKQRNLVKKLLCHDPKWRPSCQEILEGNYLPPAEFEYEHFQEIMRQTLSNPKSKAYKYLIGSCFDQDIRIEEDLAYQVENVRSEKQYFLFDLVKERLENILRKRGAIYFSAPLLQPKGKECKSGEETKVRLMTHSGNVVHLPHDLRLSFARYAAAKGFTRLRRYVIERVYREKKIHGLHPKEQYECAFDLVTPSRYAQNAEMEVLSLIQEVANGFKALKTKNCVIRLNHCLLLKAVLIHFNSEKWYSDVFRILSSAKGNKYFKSKLASNLQALGIQSANALVTWLLREDSVKAIKRDLSVLISKRGKTLESLSAAFQKFEAIIFGAERLDINIPVKVALGVVCNSEQCSDIMFDVVYTVKQKGKKEGCVTVMSGCRYDGLIASFRRIFDSTRNSFEEDEQESSAIGLTVYMDKVVAALKEDGALSEYVVVCSFSNNPFSKAKESMVRKLWEAGIKCYAEQTIEALEELTEYCRENKIVHVVNLKEEDVGFAWILTWDNDRNHYMEKRIAVREVADYILKHPKPFEELYSSPHFSRQASESQGGSATGGIGGSGSGGTRSADGYQNVNVHFVGDEKLTATQRRRYENQMRAQMSSIICRFSPRTRLEIVGVFVSEAKVKEIAINFPALDPGYPGVVESSSDRYSDKRQIIKIHSKIKNLLLEDSNAVVVLYSLSQDKYQLIFNQID